ncbi:hypothetical protein [Sphingomonas endolithica]|uniref:hypothetical protein n=1 Tax=Sphingomonas endolithica TaxID=2972485 RepID=UPI0021AE5EF5|nr:hypothetical protein [Sphingomonas sp. ZFBP2030]
MTSDLSFTQALDLAREHAARGLETYPFDAIYRTTLDKVRLIDAVLAGGGSLAEVPRDPDLGLMAAKELGNDEAAFAHALHVIQYEIEHSAPSPS